MLNIQAPPNRGERNGGYATFVWQACAQTRITQIQRKRDDNINKICAFQGGVGRGAGREIVQNAIFRGKRHDNKILKVKILLSRNFVVMAQAPTNDTNSFAQTSLFVVSKSMLVASSARHLLVTEKSRRLKSIHQYCAKGSPTTTLKALWRIPLNFSSYTHS